MANQIVLSIGSNVDFQHVSDAKEWLHSCLNEYCESEMYMTPALQGHGAPYVNAVMQGLTNLSYDDFNAMLKDYEFTHGRDADARLRDEVPVDIDIVVWNGEIVRERDYRQSFFQIGYKTLVAEE